MVDEKFLKTLKERHGHIYLADVKDQLFIFREIAPKELTLLQELYPDYARFEEQVCTLCTLYPEDYDFMHEGGAGFSNLLAQEILGQSNASGEGELAQLLEIYRNEVNHSFVEQAMIYISQAFSTLSFEEMEGWTNKELIKHLARAEWALKNIHQLPFEFAKEEASTEEETKEPPSMKEIGDQLREQGKDPMAELLPMIKKDPPYVDFPLIGGTKLFQDEGGLNRVREQI